jgi:hypothetical protein
MRVLIELNALIVLPKEEDIELTAVLLGMEAHHKSTGDKAKSKPYMSKTWDT